MITVLVADDHPLVRRGLRSLLEPLGDISVVGEVTRGTDLLTAVDATRPDVVTLDISMPGTDFLEMLPLLTKRRPRSRVLIVSMHAEAVYARRALQAGASGYITKDGADTELIEAVRTIAGGGRYVSSQLAQELAGDLARGGLEQPHESLTNREYQVMLALAAGHTITSVALDLNLSVKTVSTHRTRLLRKMQLQTNAELVRYALTHRLMT